MDDLKKLAEELGSKTIQAIEEGKLDLIRDRTFIISVRNLLEDNNLLPEKVEQLNTMLTDSLKTLKDRPQSEIKEFLDKHLLGMYYPDSSDTNSEVDRSETGQLSPPTGGNGGGPKER